MTSKISSVQPTRNVGIWIRVSTEDQAAGDSPKHHEERAREYAKFNGWTVCEVYDLAGVSGKTVMEHPEAKRMLADIRSGRISTLIFSKLARLARNTKELLDFADKFRAAGADMVSLQEKIDTSTPAGRLFYTMIAAMAQWEREEIVDRIKASITVRARLGKPLNGSAPYGFRWTDKKLVQEPSEVPVLRQMFEMFVQCRRKGRVAKILNAAGYRTRRGSPWSDTMVNRTLTAPAAKGTYFYNTTRQIGNWKHEAKPRDEWSMLTIEPVISEDLWHQTCQILESQAKPTARVGKMPVRVFGGLLVCHCGKKMYVPSSSRKYECAKGCKNKIAADDLEAIFYEEMKGYFQSPERVSNFVGTAIRRVTEKQEFVANHEREIAKVRDEMARTHRLYLEGQIPLESFGSFHKPLEERLAQLQATLPKLEAEIDHATVRNLSVDAVLKEAHEVYARWPEFAPEEKLRVVHSLVERITVGKDEIEITFSHLPSSEELTKTQQLMKTITASAWI